MQFTLSIFIIIFCFINYKIIISDKKTKKIPNKNLLQLLIILPFWYIFLYFFPFWEINISDFFIQILVSFLVSFLLFNFGIWRAWDAKYLLILSLFIPYIWIIPFIWNLGLFTLFYLFWYFLWFFFGKSFFYKWYAKSLFSSIKIDLQDKWKVHKKNKWWKSFWIILRWLVVFLIIFVSIRLFRIYIFLEFSHIFLQNWQILGIFQKYHFYLIFAIILLTIWLFYFWKKLINYIKIFLSKKLKINLRFIWNIFLFILFIFLIWFIAFEYSKKPDEISNYLIKIFTIYIFFYIFAKIIFYSYKLSFLSSEEEYINIKDLKVGMIVDKKYLWLFYREIALYIKNNNENFLKWKIIKNINNIIFVEKIIKNGDINKINNFYKARNFIIQKIKKDKNNSIDKVKILKTFPFWIYIFFWFIVTFIFWNQIINYIIKKIVEFFYL